MQQIHVRTMIIPTPLHAQPIDADKANLNAGPMNSLTVYVAIEPVTSHTELMYTSSTSEPVYTQNESLNSLGRLPSVTTTGLEQYKFNAGKYISTSF